MMLPFSTLSIRRLKGFFPRGNRHGGESDALPKRVRQIQRLFNRGIAAADDRNFWLR